MIIRGRVERAGEVTNLSPTTSNASRWPPEPHPATSADRSAALPGGYGLRMDVDWGAEVVDQIDAHWQERLRPGWKG